MPYNARAIKVLIASPSDVTSEKRLITEVIHEWNAAHSESTRLALMPVSWDTHSSPEMGDRPQAIINRQVADNCDLLVAVFWTRLGSPTGEHDSGTVEEIERHLRAGKHGMIYFSSAPVRPDSIDSEQYARLKAFKDSCQKRGLVDDYALPEDLRMKFSRQLAQTINRAFAGDSNHIELKAPRAYLDVDGLTLEARTLLLEAVNDRHGQVLVVRTSGGTHVQVNGRNLITDQAPRVVARWEAAVKDLMRRGFLEDQSGKGQVFAVTEAGYAASDRLPSVA